MQEKNKILVIGDSCEDIFIYGNVSRLAPEAPIPVINPTYRTSNRGMAGNVVENLFALGENATLITQNTEIVKKRYVCSKYNHLLLRVDENDSCERISKKVLQDINWEQYGVVIISDYCKGFLKEEDIKYISQHHPLTFLDSKKKFGEWTKDISFIKINWEEYKNNEKLILRNASLLSKTIITRGEFGCDYQKTNYPTEKVPVKDISGAGDTFLAGLVSNYIATKNMEGAIMFAQECTHYVIQKSGVSTI